jgi:adenosine deaminase
MMRHFPKAELHVHLDGTLTPALVQQLALEKSLQIDPAIFSADKKTFIWKNFSDFHRVFEESFKVICSHKDYSLITYLYLKQLAQQNCLYVELIVSPVHAKQNGVSYDQMLSGIIHGIEKAQAEFGIECRILMAILRHYGPHAALAVMKKITDQLHPWVVGVNLVGDIKQYEVKAFEQVFTMARMKYLQVSCHAGEMDGGPKEIWQAIDYLGAKRISHGITCLKDPALVNVLLDRKIILEVCPSSNVILKMYPNYASHPLAALKAAGLALTLNTDDPGFFNIDLTHEYCLAQKHFNFSMNDLLACTQQAIESGFIDSALKLRLLAKVEHQFAATLLCSQKQQI